MFSTFTVYRYYFLRKLSANRLLTFNECNELRTRMLTKDAQCTNLGLVVKSKFNTVENMYIAEWQYANVKSLASFTRDLFIVAYYNVNAKTKVYE